MQRINNMNCQISVIKKKDLPLIKELWEKLNDIHLRDSHFFKDHYMKFTFEKRCEKFIDTDDSNIRIELVSDKEIPVGYCISTIEKTSGEIDSIFVKDGYRKNGYGRILMENSIHWLKENNCTKISVAVAEGHESVYGFYQKYGFYPRMTYLQLR